MAKLGLSQLAKISHRMRTGVEAGLDDRTLWRKEAQRGSTAHRARVQPVADAVDKGRTVGESLELTGDYFPELFVSMVKIGEASGRQGAVYRRLSEHYVHMLKLRSSFLSMIFMPALELFAAVSVIALLIIALGFVASMTNSEPIDLFGLGFGTVGNLFLYLFVVGSLFGSVALVITGLIRGWFGPGPTLVALKVPLLGQTLRLMSLSRMAWSFGMAIDSGMPAKESMHLGLVSSQNAYYQSLEPRIAKSIQDGRSFQESLAETAAFPDDLVDAVEAGEMSGTVTETLERLSNDYRDRAANLFRMITVIGGFMVMGFVMLVVAAAIILIYKRLVIDQYQQLLEF